MAHPLVTLLQSLPAFKWSAREPGNLQAIQALEQEFSLQLPQDYQEFILYSNGGEVRGDEAVINLESPEILMGHNLDEAFQEYTPGIFVIGDDAGGCIYFYDPTNQLGHGVYALFLLPLGTLNFEDAIFVGKNLTEVIANIVSGESFSARLFKRDM